jgi:hypothetical protein
VADTHIMDDALDVMARRRAKGEQIPPNEHLRSCAVCREKLAFLSRFYALADEELRKPRFARIDEIVARQASRPKPIRLHAFHPSPDLATLGVVEPSILLAAQTVSEAGNATTTVATFVSERDHAIARVTRMSPGGTYAMTLVMPGDRSSGRLLISLAGASQPIPPLLTDETGSVEFTLDGQVVWDNLSVLALPPLAHFVLETPLTEGITLAAGKGSCLITDLKAGHHLVVQGIAGAGQVAVVSSSARTLTLPLSDASTIIPRPWGSEAREILVFP